MEKAGVPTVTIVTNDFVSLARSTQASQGLTDMCFVPVPHPVGMIPADEVRAKVDAAFQDILRAALAWQPQVTSEAVELKPYPADRFSFTGTYAEVNELFQSRKWSLSIPIVPPTVEAVEAMLKGTTRDPAEVLWVVPPRQGMLTVELVAALGVMAGSKPEHMPLLLAAVDALSQPESVWRGTTTTTAATYPMVVISGPIIEKLGLNSGSGVIGAQNPITNALGYFINLVGDVVGGSITPVDMSTHGTSADFVASVFVENAAANPWGQTFAEERGFKPTDSVLTLSTSYPANGNIDHNSVSGQDLLNTFTLGIAGTSSGISRCMTFHDPEKGGGGISYVMIMIGPEHAATIARDFTKQEAKDYLAKNVAYPLKYYAPGICVVPDDFGPVTEDTPIPRFRNGNGIYFVVTGGAGKQTQFWTPFPQVFKPVSVLIKD